MSQKADSQTTSPDDSETAVAPKKVTPVKKAAAKPRARAAAKPAAKQAAKAPTRATRKPVGKPAADQESTKKSKAAKPNKEAKPKKAKLVRDSFTMPETEHELLAAVKKRCIAKGLAVKKSELLRAAIIGFAAQSDSAIKAALLALEVVKTGRPSKAQK